MVKFTKEITLLNILFGKVKAKMNKKLMSMFCILGLLFYTCVSPDEEVFAHSFDVSEKVDTCFEQITQYVHGEFGAIKEVVSQCADEMNIAKSELSNLKMDDPIFIYDTEDTIQDKAAYYPVRNVRLDKILFVVAVVDTTEGINYSINTEFVPVLNSLNNEISEYIYYSVEDRIVAENKKEKKKFSIGDANDDFIDKSYEAKEKIVVDSLSNIEELDMEEEKKYADLLGAYTPTVTDELGYYYCNINNAKGQGSGNKCWAASVATIVNYIKGRNVSAKNVCDAINRGVNDGGNIDHQKKALLYYGVNYSRLDSQLSSFGFVKANIQSKRPIAIVGGRSAGLGHAFTLYGYKNVVDGQYLMIWDSALNSGTGGVSIVKYNANGTTLNSLGINYTWAATLAHITNGALVSYK